MEKLADSPKVKPVAELAVEPGVRECLQFFTREKQWINEKHLQVSRIPAPTFLEERRAMWIAEQLESLGYIVERDGGGNVVARLGKSRTGRWIALTAHLDTVLAPRVSEDISVRPDGKLLGPGVADNGAGLAALLAVARALVSAPSVDGLDSGLLLVANVGEEGEGNLSGMRYLCRQSHFAADLGALLILDGPATDHITYQALECRRYEISVTGPGGHSWSDYGTANPVHALCRFVTLYADQPFDTDPAVGERFSFNFGVIEGGTSINSIPAVARVKLDLRSENAAKAEEMVAALSPLLERAIEVENERSKGGKLTAKLREIGSRPGGRLSDDAPLLGYLRAVDSWLGIRSRLDCSSTDANIPLSMGIPAVSIGAGGRGGGAHTPGEWFHPDGRDLGLKRILLTLALLLRMPRTGGNGA